MTADLIVSSRNYNMCVCVLCCVLQWALSHHCFWHHLLSVLLLYSTLLPHVHPSIYTSIGSVYNSPKVPVCSILKTNGYRLPGSQEKCIFIEVFFILSLASWPDTKGTAKKLQICTLEAKHHCYFPCQPLHNVSCHHPLRLCVVVCDGSRKGTAWFSLVIAFFSTSQTLSHTHYHKL